MTGSTLMFERAPFPGSYRVNVTASGDNVFESGNNWRVLDIEVTGEAPAEDFFVTTWNITEANQRITIPVQPGHPARLRHQLGRRRHRAERDRRRHPHLR